MSEQTEKAKTEKAPHPTDPNRYADGTLRPNHAPSNNGKGGRRRTKYIVAFESKCSPDEFGITAWIAKLDSWGMRPVYDESGRWTGKSERDPNSNALGRNVARTWLSKTIGLAGIDDESAASNFTGVYAEYDDFTDEQTAAIRRQNAKRAAEIKDELDRIAGAGTGGNPDSGNILGTDGAETGGA